MMKNMRSVVVLALALPLAVVAQTAQPVRFIRAFGEGVVSVQPDLAKIHVSAVTQGSTAEQAAAENANVATAVNQALTAKFRGAEIRTIAYTLTPNYRSPGAGQPAVISGYTATNTIEITTSDLTVIGQVIDTAIGAGASRVDSLQLTLKDPEPSRNQALRVAGQKARARAEAIAAGVGVSLGQVVAAEEGVSYSPVSMDSRLAAEAATTPIETGSLQVRATITLQMEIRP
jgi:uncharacterized protein YggE